MSAVDPLNTWTPEQLDRKAKVEAGACTVANMRKHNGRQIDDALIAWAIANNRFVRIDRKTEWGNPFEIPKHGKMLGCWCHPDLCHGHVIAESVNAADGTP